MLTDLDCRKATCPPGKPRARLADAQGLYLEVSPTGARRWFYKFVSEGKERRLALGQYPAVTLKAARLARDEAKRQRATGADPVQARKAAKLAQQSSSANTFEAVARAFHAAKAPGWSAVHAKQWLQCCEKDLFPDLGALPLGDITAPMLLAVLRKVERRGALQTVRDLREFAGQVFRFGIAEGHCASDPARDLVGAFKAHTKRHLAALTEPAKVGELMRAIDAYPGQPTTRGALLLSAWTLQRPGNVRAARWADLDLDGGRWVIPAVDMKRTLSAKINGKPHIVPLSRQAVVMLRELHPMTKHSEFVFPSLLSPKRCMSDGTVNTALRRLGFSNQEATAHGFRAMGRTMMVEQLAAQPEVIEALLAHAKPGALGAAYDRAEYLEQRAELVQTWGNYLEGLMALR